MAHRDCQAGPSDVLRPLLGGRLDTGCACCCSRPQHSRNSPTGLRLFEYLSGLSQPLRVPDLLEHLRSLGLPDLEPPVAVGPAVPFLAAPVQHRGERVGNFFLAKTGTPGFRESGVQP